MNTGTILAGRPSLGSWVSYGLGSENQNLPGVRRAARQRRRAARRHRATGAPASCRPRIRARGSASGPSRSCTSRPPEDDRRRAAAAASSTSRRAEPAPRGRARRRQRAGRPHRRLRAGLPHAGRTRPRRSTCRSETAETQRALRPGRQGDRRDRPQLPAGPPAGRARRAVRAGLLRLGQQVGRPRQHRREPQRPVPRQRSGRSPACLADLKRRGPARRDAGDLGRRVRPHADARKRRRPRPQPLRLHDVAGRRRRERRARPSARPTSSACTPSTRRSTSTTSTPRSCT